ncbi:MAG: HD domain-containing protein [Lachnospiraceae bacterium]
MSKEEVDRYIYEVGSGVIDASVFQAGYFQKHHMRTSVAAHTLNVAQSSVYLGRFLEHLGVRVNMHDLVLASLCHDLGIVGRYAKYANNRECCNRHPLDSEALAKKLIPDVDEVVLNSIACHMWPIGPTGHPSHIEGFIVTLADKYSSVKDLVKPNGWDCWRKPVAGSSTTRQDAGATA